MESGSKESLPQPAAAKRGFDWRFAVVALVALGVGFGSAWFLAAKVNAKKGAADDEQGEKAAKAFALASTADSISYAYGVVNSLYDDDVKTYLLNSGSEAKYTENFFKGMEDGLLTPSDSTDVAYQLGYLTGLQTKFSLSASEASILPDGSKISMAGVLQGMKDGRNGTINFKVDGRNLTIDEIADYLTAVGQRSQRKAMNEKQMASEDFMDEMAEQPDVHALEGGVLYKVITVGEGSTPTRESEVEVEYSFELADGKVVDSTHGKTATFKASKVFPGFTTALCHMPAGSEWEVYIPWQQAFGAEGSGPIPPYSALVANIKLINIK